MHPTHTRSAPSAKASRRGRGSDGRSAPAAITAMPAPLALSAPESQRESAAERHHRMVAEAAYFRALNRGFNGGDPQEDWYVAEREILHATGAHR
jgi:hypothetical protein